MMWLPGPRKYLEWTGAIGDSSDEKVMMMCPFINRKMMLSPTHSQSDECFSLNSWLVMLCWTVCHLCLIPFKSSGRGVWGSWLTCGVHSGVSETVRQLCLQLWDRDRLTGSARRQWPSASVSCYLSLWSSLAHWGRTERQHLDPCWADHLKLASVVWRSVQERGFSRVLGKCVYGGEERESVSKMGRRFN